jgi:hypothetical protein
LSHATVVAADATAGTSGPTTNSTKNKRRRIILARVVLARRPSTVFVAAFGRPAFG